MKLVFNGTIVALEFADSGGSNANVWINPEITLRIDHEGLQTNYTGLIQSVGNKTADVNDALIGLLDAPSVKVTIEPLIGGK